MSESKPLIRIQNDAFLPQAILSVRYEKAWQCIGIVRPHCVKMLFIGGSRATYDFNSEAEAKSECARVIAEWAAALESSPI